MEEWSGAAGAGSAEGARWVRRAQLNMPGNNGLVSVDRVSGIRREVANPMELRRRLSEVFPDVEGEVAISWATTPKSHDRVAFLVMDYGRTYAILLINREGEVDQMIGREVPDGYMVGMGAPHWSADGGKTGLLRVERPEEDALHRGLGRGQRPDRQGLAIWSLPEARTLGHIARRSVGMGAG